MIAQRLLNRLKTPLGPIGVVVCLLFPLGWDNLYPRLEGTAAFVPMTDFDLTAVPGAGPVFEPTEVIDEGEFTVLLLHREWRELRVNIEDPGRYSLYGVTSHSLSQPLDLIVNGVLVSSLAFSQKTGSPDGLFERRRIARAVDIPAGENTLRIEGRIVHSRPLLLVLQPEHDLSVARYFALLAVAALVFIALLWVPFYNPVAVRHRLWLAVAVFSGILIAFPVALALVYGEELADLGVRNELLYERVEAFEAYMESRSFQKARTTRKTVAMLGDSTHVLFLEPDDQMIPTVRRKIPDELKDGIEIYGLASGALSAFDFYFFMNQLVDEKPDLIMMPINQRWFSEERIYGVDRFDFYYLEGLVRWSEIPRLSMTTVGDRKFRLSRLLFHKVSYDLTGGRGYLFVAGLRKYFELLWRQTSYNLKQRYPELFAPIPPLLAGATVTAPLSQWNDSIEEDHDFFKMFRLMNRLAKRHGIPVLYYSSNQDVERNRALGLDMKIQENTAIIRKAVTTDRHIYFLDLAKENPPEIFVDLLGHLSPQGVSMVADRLLPAIMHILELDSGEPVPDLVHGPL